MVDTYGRWTYEPNTPEEQKCDCDRIADWIYEKQYKIQTNLENLVLMIISHFDCPERYGDCGSGDEFTIEGCKQYVEDSGGFAEFDYYC